MASQKIISIIILVLSTIAIVSALIINYPTWLIYIIAIFAIPSWILSLGLLTMAKPKKEDVEERIKEPFTGY